MIFFKKNGFTIVELLIVISIIIILLAIVLPQFGKARDIQVLNSSVADLSSLVHDAKSKTLASLNSQVYGVLFETNKATITKGSSCSLALSNYEITNLLDSVSLLNIKSLPSDKYCFDKLSGMTYQNSNVEFVVKVRSHGVKFKADATGNVQTITCPCDLGDNSSCCNNI